MEILFQIILFSGGVLGGFFGSTVGSAGLISFPILIFLGLPLPIVVATSRPAAVILELISAFRFYKEGKLTVPLFRRGLFLGIAGAIGGIIGSRLVVTVSEKTLQLLFSLVIFSMLLFLLMKKNWGLREEKEKQNHMVFLSVATFFSGIYGGFFGFTFGTLITFVFVLFGYTLLQSAVLARIIGAITAFAGTLVFAFGGFIHFSYASSLAVGFGVGAWFGAGVAAKKGSKYVKLLLILISICSVIKLLFDYFSINFKNWL